MRRCSCALALVEESSYRLRFDYDVRGNPYPDALRVRRRHVKEQGLNPLALTRHLVDPWLLAALTKVW